MESKTFWDFFIEILPWLGTIIGSGGIFGLVTYLVTVKQERKKLDLDNESTAVRTLRETIEEVRQEKAQAIEERDQYKSLYEQVREEKETIINENVIVKHCLCVHYGCFLRKPIRGMGDSWFDKNKEDPLIGGDNLSTWQLLSEFKKNKDSIIRKALDPNDPNVDQIDPV